MSRILKRNRLCYDFHCQHFDIRGCLRRLRWILVHAVSVENGDTGGHVVKPGHYIHGCRRAGGVTVEFFVCSVIE